MDLLRRIPRDTRRLGIFPGSFNPPTKAHLQLAHAALARVDEVLIVLPRIFPHKDYLGATLEERVAMLQAAFEEESRFSIATTNRGLFVEIAREAREHYADAELFFLCGRDAAERIINWRYEDDSIERMMQEFGLLVARRQGEYLPPGELQHRIEALPVEGMEDVSSTAVRDRIARAQAWQEMVPAAIAPMVQRIYSRRLVSRKARNR